MDNTVTAALENIEKASPWLICLVVNGGDKNKCLDEVRDAHLVSSEPKVMAVLVLLSLNGIWTILFLGRTSMLIGWVDFLRSPFRKQRTDFVSVDARRFSGEPKHYEMIMSPQSQGYNIPQQPEAAVTPPLGNEKEGLAAIPQSPTSQYSQDYFSKETRITKTDAHPYYSPKLSFSTPRPPSAGRINSRDLSHNQRPFSPQLSTVGTSRSTSRTGVYTPAIEWDPTSTHAKSFGSR